MQKQTLIQSLALSGCLAIGAGVLLSHGTFALATPAARQVSLRPQIEQFVAQHTSASHWTVEKLNITQESVRQTPTSIEAVFSVQLTHRLGYPTPDATPLMQGKRDWLELHGGELSADRRAQADRELEWWRETLSDYIHNPQEAGERLKVSAVLGRDGRIEPDTLELLMEDPKGRYFPAEEFLDSIRNESEARQDSIKAMDVAMESAVASLYSRTNAVTYINKYVVNTSKYCSGGSALSDTSKYNTSYANYACNDCANYVSQALKKGGIPTNSTWSAGTSAWINVDSLKSFMVGTKGYWKSISRSASKKGDIILLGSSSDYYHTMMVAYFDGSTMKYSAHTNDRNQSSFGGTSDSSYWQVVY